MARIRGIQRLQERFNNPYLHKLEINLQRELVQTLKQEEIMWYQKSWIQWITDGDKNTKYHHTKTVVRRNKNKDSMLWKENGEWTNSNEEIYNLIIDYYKKLFKEEEEEDKGNVVFSVSYTKLIEAQIDTLNKMVTEKEIKNACFSIGSTKALGEDCGYWNLLIRYGYKA